MPVPETPRLEGQLARLLTQHRTALYGYIFACLRDHHGAEDVLQEVSVAVIESAGQLRDLAGFLPWAREIARRRVLAHRRRAGREQPVDPQLAACLAEAAARMERTRPSAGVREALKVCLDRLPEAARRLLLMRYGEGAGADELARRIGRTVQGVYAIVKRAKESLRGCLNRLLAREGKP